MIPSQPPPDLNETNWIVQVNESVRRMPTESEEGQCWKKRSIYRVPACITELNQKAYWPQAVSFGPYHHGEEQLLPMEEHKQRALRHFLWRSRKQVEHFLKDLVKVEQDLKDSYHMLDPKWEESGSEGVAGPFLQLMITDGCFMLEILRSRTDDPPQDYPPNDPIFSEQWGFYAEPHIKRDMLMLENQLPMLVLERLVAVESDGREGHEYIKRLIFNFYEQKTHITMVSKCLHVLDVLKESLLFHEKMPFGVQLPLDNVGTEWSEEITRSVTELIEAGIILKKSETHSLKDISFADGVLSLPAIVVDGLTESMFLNLMTFESLHFGAGDRVTAYIFFMDSIIDTKQDAALLRTQGIIQNVLGSDEMVAELFNSIAIGKILLPKCDESVQKKINEHCKRTWNTWRATLIHTYFRSPWSFLSLIAAIFLFALTIIQTVYAVLSYSK